jgi:hypothetical protein
MSIEARIVVILFGTFGGSFRVRGVTKTSLSRDRPRPELADAFDDVAGTTTASDRLTIAARTNGTT